MQFSLVQFGAIAAGEPEQPGNAGEGGLEPENGLEPIIIDLSELPEQGRAHSLIYNAAEFLMTSLSGCIPKRR